jgi:benzoyl-CoA reductase/2-hydroxyglutaryl-CoA dehydratase subunit BcrC/BadD/HgdB
LSVDAALAALSGHYQNRRAVALEKHAAGMPVVGFTSNTIPWELIRAAGCFPVLVSPLSGATPLADQFMEPVFDRRIRGIFDAVLAGDWSFLKLLIIPRTSEPEYKLYLYLREMVRQQRGAASPPVHLYDLLHTRSVRSRRYGRERTEDLKRRLEELVGRAITVESFRAAVDESNAARQAIRRLLKLRRSAPKLSGTEAMTAIGACYFMDREKFAKLAGDFAAAAGGRPPLPGPRLLVKGVAVDHVNLYRVLESHGAVVVAEDDWWGSRAAGRDVVPGPDPVAAVFPKYYLDAPSPRVFPAKVADRWFERTAQRGIDGVVFYHPPDDDVYGWDYPRQRQFLERQGIPSLRIREDCSGDEVSPGLHGDIESFVNAIAGRSNGNAA